MNEQMTINQAEAWMLFQQLQCRIDQSANLDEISKEAHKELFDVAKELFLHHDEDKALVHAVKLVEVLRRRKR